MSKIDIRPTHAFNTAGPPRADSSPTGPIARIVAGSVLLGLVGALFLSLVVFAGASEHVITGSALLAFAAGWTALAVLSTRMTNQPQRWAVVPAASMGVVGAALLLFSPGDDGLSVPSIMKKAVNRAAASSSRPVSTGWLRRYSTTPNTAPLNASRTVEITGLSLSIWLSWWG